MDGNGATMGDPTVVAMATAKEVDRCKIFLCMMMKTDNKFV